MAHATATHVLKLLYLWVTKIKWQLYSHSPGIKYKGCFQHHRTWTRHLNYAGSPLPTSSALSPLATEGHNNLVYLQTHAVNTQLGHKNYSVNYLMIFWVSTPCGRCVLQCFEGTSCLPLQGGRIWFRFNIRAILEMHCYWFNIRAILEIHSYWFNIRAILEIHSYWFNIRAILEMHSYWFSIRVILEMHSYWFNLLPLPELLIGQIFYTTDFNHLASTWTRISHPEDGGSMFFWNIKCISTEIQKKTIK